MKKYDDIRSLQFSDNEELDFTDADIQMIKTLTFNEDTVFPRDLETIKKRLIDLGKNPGFGVKKLHEKGINGNNVTVAIIDQPLFLNHFEYKDKIIAYKNFDEEKDIEDTSSMHGPAVTSLLVGSSIGTAPKAKMVYAAIPTWKANQDYAIEAINWIIDINKKLPDNDKVRVISISASPPSWNNKNKNKWVKNDEEFQANLIEWEKTEQRALDNNILIISCTQNKYLLSSCYYDIDSPDDLSLVKTGYHNYKDDRDNCLLLPTSLRTVAEHYEKEKESYTYFGEGGLSWGIPFLCGCLAMGWQINPSIKAKDIMTYVYETGFIKDNNIIIDPTSFIKRIISLTSNKEDNQTKSM